MKTFGSRGYWLFLPLLATVGWESCHRLSPQSQSKTEHIRSECKLDDDVIEVNINDQLKWEASDNHTYLIHFKDRTPLTINGKPAKTVHLGEQALVSGDGSCMKHGDTDCYFPYFLHKYKGTTPNDPEKDCSDPGVHVTP